MYRLKVEHHYSKCYPTEHTNDSNYFEIAFNTVERANQYINDLYDRTKDKCDQKPIKLEHWGWVLQTRDYIPKEKQVKRKKYEQIRKQDIETYIISVWFYTKY